MKKLLSIILTILVIVTAIFCVAISASASTLPSSGQCGDYVYLRFDETKLKLVISGDGDIYSISDEIFPGLEFKEVVIESGVTSIGNKAFYGCSALKSIINPEGATSIEELTFFGCSVLESITLSNTIEYIASDAFLGCKYLFDVYFNGTEEEWTRLMKRCYNECLDNAILHFNDNHIHSFVPEIIKTPTCTADGITIYVCDCGYYFFEIATTTGHAYSNYGVCEKCNEYNENYNNSAIIISPTPDSENCSCACHASGIMGFFWKIFKFFFKLFNSNQICTCGIAHY